METEKKKSQLSSYSSDAKRKIGTLAAVTALVYFFLKFLLPVTAPFFMALFFYYAGRRFFHKCRRITKCSKCFFLIGVGGFLLLFLGGITWIVGWNVKSLVVTFFNNIGNIGETWKIQCHHCCEFVACTFGADEEVLEKELNAQTGRLFSYFRKDFPVDLFRGAYGHAKSVMAVFLFLGLTIAFLILLVKDAKKIEAWFRREETFSVLLKLGGRVLSYGGIYLRAQFIIFLVICGICYCGFWILKLADLRMLSFLAGMMDTLPFLGTGIVLVPLAVFLIFQTQYFQGIGILLLYVACIGARELLEPKLIGKKMGIYPVFVLLSLYAGIHLFGITGIFKGPLGMLLIQEGYKLLYRGDE